MRKQASHDVLDSIGIIQARGLSSSHQSLGDYFESGTPWVLLDLTDQVFPALKSAFLLLCLRADFAFFHASCSRESSFERVNLRRAARHSRRSTDNWSFHQYIESRYARAPVEASSGHMLRLFCASPPARCPPTTQQT